ncbi:Fungal-trans domain-containing protein [Mycena indigotica]|uniref:Fungal-trans domain-containing protein n=1 Tax=Mycena indigotica TaxID=2126181 RepID=A0A8H6SFA0_9AGAR|nr:Fungal-trans domain-containing protein [Mycena indigotica]KAF7296770.1 Fungal-trans domain-containing protein [Mycena indigotica]
MTSAICHDGLVVYCIRSLVHIYFQRVNPLFGILHQSRFENALQDGAHFNDRQFGALVLAVCCVASRCSDDPRVLTEEADGDEHSCGWGWYKQIRPLRATFSLVPSLAQLQTLALCLLYMVGTSNPEEGWLVVGMGIRFCQAAGGHLQELRSKLGPIEAELYKRLYWLFVASDVLMGISKGRPSSARLVDMDLELPLACDEAYWELPDPAQPPGTPSVNAYFTAYYELVVLYERIQQVVYPAKADVTSCGNEAVAELDLALNAWVDRIPLHLKWDPEQKNQIFLDQSASLYASYYHAQIILHRAFIPPPTSADTISNRNSNTTLPSLAICANAARACGHICDVQAKRGRGVLPSVTVMLSLFDAAVVLLVNVWAVVDARSVRPHHWNVNPEPKGSDSALLDTNSCLRVLRLYERRYRVAGRNCDVLAALINYGRITLEAAATRSAGEMSRKRRRSPGTEWSPPDATAPSNLSVSDSSATSAEQQIEALVQSLQETGHLFDGVPMHSTELGNMPIYSSSSIFAPSTSPQMHQDLSLAALDELGLELLPTDLQYLTQHTGQELELTLDVDAPWFHAPLGLNYPPNAFSWDAWNAYFIGVDELNQEFF